ncbi:MAG: PHP domain-containing protein [Chloroflexi bacterium]|nr:PHP domain-containing protein [Chloroflexota bacterium]
MIKNLPGMNFMEEIIINLHMHTRYSDGGGSHHDIATAALHCGLDAVIVTDHNVLVKDFERYVSNGRRKVLMLIGEEVHDQGRKPQKNHLLVFGANQELAVYSSDPQALINAAKDSGGLSFIAHPNDPLSRTTPALKFGTVSANSRPSSPQNFTVFSTLTFPRWSRITPSQTRFASGTNC